MVGSVDRKRLVWWFHSIFMKIEYSKQMVNRYVVIFLLRLFKEKSKLIVVSRPLSGGFVAFAVVMII